MTFLHRLKVFLAWRLRRRRIESALDSELEEFVEQYAADRIREGMAEGTARREARLALGGVEQTKERVRAGRPLAWLDSLLGDVRYGTRVLSKDRAYSLLAILILTIGIAGTTAMYSFVHGILIRPLPYGDPEALVGLRAANLVGVRRASNIELFAYEYAEVAGLHTVFDDVAFYRPERMVLDEIRYPAYVNAYIVSPGFLSTLRVRPIRGRAAAAPDDSGTLYSAVVSHEFWHRHFGGDPDLVGRTIRFQDFSVRITGIMAPEFRFPTGRTIPGEMWITIDDALRLNPVEAEGWSARGGTRGGVVGRLRDGVGWSQAESALEAASRSIDHPPEAQDINGGFDTRNIYPVDLREEEVASARRPLFLFSASVFAVYLVALLNVSSLTVGRAIGREREVALRMALGSSRLRLIRQFLTEGLLLAGSACFAAIVLLLWTMDGIVAMFAGNLPRLADVRLDRSVLAFGIATAAVSAAAFGLVPVLALRGANLARNLADGSAQLTEGIRNRTGRSAIVAVELAVTLVLLVATGLIFQSFLILVTKPTGIDAENVLLVGISEHNVENAQQRTRFWQSRIDAVRAVPGVGHVAVANLTPLSGANAMTAVTSSGGRQAGAVYGLVTDDYFDVFRIRLLEGRYPAEDRPETVVNETLARRLWPGESPIGRVLEEAGNRGPYAVVGLISDVRTYPMTDPGPEMYVASSSAYLQFYVRTEVDPPSAIPTIIEAIHSVDPRIPVPSVVRFDDVASDAFAGPWFRAVLFGAFAAVTLVLAATGVYGVASHTVARRRSEFAIRAALGARPPQLIGLVLWQGARPLAIGLALGLAGAAAVTRLLESFLFEITPTDPGTFLAAAGLLALLGLLANLIPALRLTRFDPGTHLRHE